ncbi:MAG: C-terminal binding protein [Pseudomonadota bacterium]
MLSKAVAVLEPGYADYRAEQAVLAPLGAEIVAIGKDDDAVSGLRGLDPVAILVRERPVSAVEIAACPSLKLVMRYGVGVDNVDMDAAKARGIYVANVPDYGAEREVSDHAVALYLALQRRVVSRDRAVRNATWGCGSEEGIPGREGAILGLVGFGRIGSEAARKFGVFGFEQTLVVDPFADEQILAERGMQRVSIDDLCRKADVISLHTPLLPETRHIIDVDRLAMMKPTTIIINVSRGGLIDEMALADALKERRLFGAGIDVFEQEPVEPDHPLLTAPNTVLSDHIAWYSERSTKTLQTSAAEEVARVLNGQRPKNWRNKWSDDVEPFVS